MTDALAHLIDALARADAEDYLREIAADSCAEQVPAPYPVLPATDVAA